MAKSQEEKQFIQLAGEFGVASELFRRRIQASITYGNSKSTDIVVISGSGSRAARVEVKSAVIDEWIVGAQALNAAPHVVWVFVHLPEPTNAFSRAQLAEVGKAAPKFHVMASAHVKSLYEEKVRARDAGIAARIEAAELASIIDAQGASEDSEEPAAGSTTKPKGLAPIVFHRHDVDGGFNEWDLVRAAL